MRIGFILLVTFALLNLCSTNDHDYPPGINFMMRDILIDKFREVIVPQVMEEYKTIKPDDVREKHWYFEFAIYNMAAMITPLTPDQLTIKTIEKENALYIKVDGFQVEFAASAYCRILFFGMHGSADISLKINTFEFKVAPEIYESGNFNDLTYEIPLLNIVVLADDINVEHLSIGILPNWIMKPIANGLIHHCQSAIDSFRNVIVDKIMKILEEHRKDIPDMVEIPSTTMSASLSFPGTPKLYDDRIEIPFDGTVFITTEGYDPQTEHAETLLPTSNEDDENNVQFFIHQHMLKTDFATVKKAGLSYMIDSDWAAQFKLPDDVFTVKYFQMLFPFMSCHYESNVPIKVELGIDEKLPTDITFVEGGLIGKISPKLKFYAGDDLAITIMFTAEITADIDFKVRDKGAYAHGVLKTIDLDDMAYVKATVEYSDLPAIVENFEERSEMLFKKTTDAILDTGVYIPAITLYNGLFEVDLEMITMEFKKDYLYTSFNLDIHQRLMMLKAMRKNMFKTTSTLEALLKTSSKDETCTME